MRHDDCCISQTKGDIPGDLGMCPTGLRQYRQLLTGARLPYDRLAGCLRFLELATEDPDDPGSARAVPPLVASEHIHRPLLDHMATYRELERRIRLAYAETEQVYAEVRRNEQPTVTVHQGAESITAALDAAVGECTEELLTAHPGGGRPTEVLAEALERDMRLLSRKVVQRTIYQHTVRTHQPTLTYIDQVTAAGAEVRTLTEVFERIIICDREVAFIPVADERRTTALEIRHPGIVRYLALGFHRDWARAVPVAPDLVAPRSGAVTSDIQRAILKGVISGETDETIGRRLGLSRRSVAEHVRKISARLGSNSRAQLGYLAAKFELI
jgi:DNA-binding CsgD family transcriptional regulator